MAQKKGKLLASHRYNLLPLLPSGPGGIQRELVVYDFPDAKIATFLLIAKFRGRQGAIDAVDGR